MMNKEIILLIEELKQQVEECRDRDSSNYIDSLLKRTDWIINQLNVNNGVLDDVSQQRELFEIIADRLEENLPFELETIKRETLIKIISNGG